jgi:hypothetical protein
MRNKEAMVKLSNSSCRCKKREQNLTESLPGFQYEPPEEEIVLPRQCVEASKTFSIIPERKSKPEVPEQDTVIEVIRPGHPMWTNGWRIHIGGLRGTDANPIRLPKPIKPESKPESDSDKNPKSKTKR